MVNVINCEQINYIFQTGFETKKLSFSRFFIYKNLINCILIFSLRSGGKIIKLKAPFPWFGGKSRAAPIIWERLGTVDNYVEPFAGSLAVLLGAPRITRTETINDKDGYVVNFWRATSRVPQEVAKHADWPVNEIDLTARHIWLLQQRDIMTSRLEADPDYYDAKIAGWWVWGICCWIGSGWCSGEGPWMSDGSKLVRLGAGKGVNRQLVHLGAGKGVNRKLVHLGSAERSKSGLYAWFTALSDRLSRVRVCCGDWSRICGPTPTVKLGLTGVVLDPPYSEDERTPGIYAHDSNTVAVECREWAREKGNDPRMRIVLCGYDTEHDLPGWERVKWTAKGGYGKNDNKYRETLWFSPHCLKGRQGSLFDTGE